MSRKVDLTYLLHNGMMTYPTHYHPFTEIVQLGRFGIEERESRRVTLGTHTGTHCDAPRHFVPGGETVENLDLDVLIGPAFVVDFSHAAPLQMFDVDDFTTQLGDRQPERIVMHFGWDKHWGNLQKFYNENPYISDAAAQWMVDNGVRLLAMDTPMPDSPKHGRGTDNDSPCHRILLGNGVVLVEYLCNLGALTRPDIELIVLPLKIKDGDGSPVRCVAIEA
jgi:kynurenine formamidase